MIYPDNYSKIYTYFNEVLKLIDKDALDNNKVDDVYYTLKKYLNIAFEKCSYNSFYCDGWLIWFSGKKSTIHLRELFKSISCDYWDSLIYSNAIDRLDSLQYKIINNK